jgi:hypothetical protein
VKNEKLKVKNKFDIIPPSLLLSLFYFFVILTKAKNLSEAFSFAKQIIITLHHQIATKP